MKQVFDPSQYKHCDKDWYDGNDIPEGMKIALGIMVLLPPPLNMPSITYFTMGNKLCFSPYGCSKGLEMQDGLCYPPCKPNYHGVGPVCWEDNKPGWIDVGAIIRENCKPGYHEVLAVCWEDNKPGWVDVGALVREGCKAGWHEVAGVCWEDNKPGMVDVGALVREGCRPGHHEIAGVCWEDTPPGWVDVGALIRQGCGGCCPKDVAGVCWNNDNNPYGSSYVPTTRARGSYVPNTVPRKSYIPPTVPRKSYVPPSLPRPSYGRGAGLIPFEVKFKERLVPIGGN